MVEYSLEQIKPLVEQEEFTEVELEVLPLVLEGRTPTQIRESLEPELSQGAIQKRLGSIYKKMGTPGDGPTKIKRLREQLLDRIHEQDNLYPILIVWSGAFGQKMAKYLKENVLVYSKGLKINSSSSDLQSGLWRDELNTLSLNVEICFVCLSASAYEHPLVNAAVGYLNGSLKTCKIVYTETQRDLLSNSSLSYFSNICWEEPQEWARSIHKFTNQTIEDAEIFMAHGLLNKCKLDAEKYDVKAITDKRKDYLSGIESLIDITNEEYLTKELNYLEQLLKCISISSLGKGEIVVKAKSGIDKVKQDVRKKVESRLNSLFQTQREDSQAKFEKIVREFSGKIDDLDISALIIRARDSEDNLEEWITWGDEGKVKWDSRDSVKRGPGEGYIQGVLSYKEPKVVPNISKGAHLFKNKEWIEDNEFASFASFPLMNGSEEALGTFSMYFLEKYDISLYPYSYAFIECVTSLISNLIIRRRSWQALEELIGVDKKELGKLDFLEEMKAFIPSLENS